MKFISSGLVTIQRVMSGNASGTFWALPTGNVYLPLFRFPIEGDGYSLEAPVSQFWSRRSKYDSRWSDCDHREIDGTLVPSDIFGHVYSQVCGKTVCYYSIVGKIKQISSRNHLEADHSTRSRYGYYYEADVVHPFENTKYTCVFIGNRQTISHLYDGYVWAMSKTSDQCVGWSIRGKSLELLTREIPLSVSPSGTSTQFRYERSFPRIARESFCKTLFADFEALTPKWSDRPVGELSNDCLSNVRACGTNSIGFLLEIKKILDPFLQIAKAVTHPTPKSLASAYLSFQYGLANTVRDLQAYADKASQAMAEFSTVHKFSLAHTRSSYTSVYMWDGKGPKKLGYADLSSTQCYHICYDPIDSAVLNAWRLLDSWGLWPSLSGTWDLVPLSFVLDWFIPLGNIFEANDNMTHLASLYTVFASHSVKHTVTTDANEVPALSGWQGVLTYKSYVRSVKGRVDYPAISFSGSDLSSHWVEGSALLVQLL